MKRWSFLLSVHQLDSRLRAAMATKRVVVIGAGPAGLTTLKTLLHFPRSLSLSGPAFDPILLEAAASIGGTFDQRSYENGCLVSSKQLTSFSDCESFPRSGAAPLTIGLTQIASPARPETTRPWESTLNTLADTSTASDSIRRQERDGGEHRWRVSRGFSWGAGWRKWSGVRVEDTMSRTRLRVVRAFVLERREVELTRDAGTYTIHADALSVCTGLHVTPAVPMIPGLPSLLSAQSPPILTAPGLPTLPPGGGEWDEKDGVRVIHSSQYKKREEFAGRKVLILGVRAALLIPLRRADEKHRSERLRWTSPTKRSRPVRRRS